jgi:uncharacterized delta-60 repeat protein
MKAMTREIATSCWLETIARARPTLPGGGDHVVRHGSSGAIMNNWLETLESRRLMDGGNLDTSFGTGGFIEVASPPGMNLAPYDVDVDPQGDIVLTLRANDAVSTPFAYLARYHVDGTLATSFGNNGRVDLPSAGVAGTHILPDGSIVITVHDRLYKFRSNGTRDRAFGQRGGMGFEGLPLFTTDVDGAGNIYVAGEPTVADQFKIMRLHPDGTLDSSYTPDPATFPANLQKSFGIDIKALPDGRLMLAGVASTGLTTFAYTVIRLDADGNVDPSYGNNGSASGAFGGGPEDVGPIEAVNLLNFADDGSAFFEFTIAARNPQTGGIGEITSRKISGFDPDGNVSTFNVEVPPDEFVGGIVRHDALIVSSRGQSAVGPRFFDETGATLTAPTDAAAQAARISSASEQRYGKVVIANDGTLLVFNQTMGPDVQHLDNIVRLHRLFRDDAPVAQLEARNLITRREASYRFTIQYRDDDGIDVSSLGDDDITVALPGGGRRKARLVSTDATGNPKVVHAIYKVTAPDGVWSFNDNGDYIVRIERRSVRDINGNAAAQRPIGLFRVVIPPDVVVVTKAPQSRAPLSLTTAATFDELITAQTTEPT